MKGKVENFVVISVNNKSVIFPIGDEPVYQVSFSPISVSDSKVLEKFNSLKIVENSILSPDDFSFLKPTKDE